MGKGGDFWVNDWFIVWVGVEVEYFYICVDIRLCIGN